MSESVDPGYKKADTNNLPNVSSEMLYSYITQIAQRGLSSSVARISDYRIDYVQLKRKNICVLKGKVFNQKADDGKEYKVEMVVNELESEISVAVCEECAEAEAQCVHIVAFLFWVHHKSIREGVYEVKRFWGSENNQNFEDRSAVLQIKDVFDDRDNIEEEFNEEVSQDDGEDMINAILEDYEKVGLTDTEFYKHFRPTVDEFESVFIHHSMLDNANNYIRDYKTFVMHMEESARRGLFESLREITATNYKRPIWMETQFCRIRCSQMHRISARKDTSDDEAILESIFCTDREGRMEERKLLKEHKKYILKQTERLENKAYQECGLILCESYPYVCASPDGMTDDHIVEIKAPKTDEEFEKYLIGKETIAPKYMAQIQIQMYLANVPKALYCVLSPTFDVNGALHYVWVKADMQLIVPLLSAAEDFWKEVVFPRLKKIHFNE